MKNENPSKGLMLTGPESSTEIVTSREARALVLHMLIGFGSSRGGQEDTEVVAKVYAEDLLEFPLWAVQRGCSDFRRGKVADVNRAFAPSTAQLCGHVRHLVQMKETERLKAEQAAEQARWEAEWLAKAQRMAALAPPPPEPEPEAFGPWRPQEVLIEIAMAKFKPSEVPIEVEREAARIKAEINGKSVMADVLREIAERAHKRSDHLRNGGPMPGPGEES